MPGRRGYLQVLDGMTAGAGVVGTTFATGESRVVSDVRCDDGYLEAVPGASYPACTDAALNHNVIRCGPVPRPRRTDSLSPEKILRLIAHPQRVEILDRLATRGKASPREIADELGAELGTVSYHVRTLHGAGLIEAAGTVPRRGAIEHFYRVTDPEIAFHAQALVNAANELVARARQR